MSSAILLPNHLYRRAFTLLELLVVVAILAIVAGGVIAMMDGAESGATSTVNQTEMLELKQAVLSFQQNTGWLPKQGPFALTTDPVPGFIDPANALHWPAAAPASSAARQAWFHSPANFYQLYENPLQNMAHPLNAWNPATKRGWKGPYLSRDGEGLVDISQNLGSNGTGNPAVGSSGDVLANLYGVADPYQLAPIGSFNTWRSSLLSPNHARWGRPYFLFGLYLTDPTQTAALKNQVRLLGTGPNGVYDSSFDTFSGTVIVGGDDIVLYVLQ